MQITLRYDGYNRQFNLIDRPVSSGLEDGRTYVITINDDGINAFDDAVNSLLGDENENPYLY
jgi:hypothetical protein